MPRQNSPTQSAPSLGLGVYGLAEVSRYTQLNPSRVRSWFKGRSDGRGRGRVFSGDYRPIQRDYAVSFHDLIDVLVVGQFREFGVSMRIIRATHGLLQKQLATSHPFCHENLYTDGRKIFIVTADEVGDEILSEVVTRQQFFLHVRECLTRIQYDATTRLASRWQVADGVVIDPRVSLGKPVVATTGTTTFVIANAYKANGEDAGLVAELFDIRESSVFDAVEFERRIRMHHAA